MPSESAIEHGTGHDLKRFTEHPHLTRTPAPPEHCRLSNLMIILIPYLNKGKTPRLAANERNE